MVPSSEKNFPRVITVPYTLWWRCYIERYNQQLRHGDSAARGWRQQAATLHFEFQPNRNR